MYCFVLYHCDHCVSNPNHSFLSSPVGIKTNPNIIYHNIDTDTETHLGPGGLSSSGQTDVDVGGLTNTLSKRGLLSQHGVSVSGASHISDEGKSSLVFFSILVVSYFMWSAALDSSLWCSSIILYNITSIAYNHHLIFDIYPL